MLLRLAVILVLVLCALAQNATEPLLGTAEPVLGFAEGNRFWPSLVTAFLMIFVSELGDKTFLIAAILAMRHARLVVFVSAFAALAVMTVLSAAFGFLVPSLIPRNITIYISAVLFLAFGLKMVSEARGMRDTDLREEYDEVSHEIAEQARKSGQDPIELVELGAVGEHVWGEGAEGEGVRDKRKHAVLLQTFTLTFLAEWGDRSQIATIVLAAAQNVWGVAIGAVLGHAVCTLLAVISGRLLASVLSIRAVTMIGGILFILFAVVAIV